MPLVLAFDTAGPHCAAALLSEERIVAERLQPMVRGQAERLLPMLEEMLAGAGIGWADLDAVGVGTGPGNFTGIRIGVSAARGLAMALGVPAVGVTATDALLMGAPEGAVAAIPAPRGRAYVARAGEDPALLEAAPDEALAPDPEANPAIAVARIAAAGLGTPGPRPAPTYVRPPDAAPGRRVPPAA